MAGGIMGAGARTRHRLPPRHRRTGAVAGQRHWLSAPRPVDRCPAPGAGPAGARGCRHWRRRCRRNRAMDPQKRERSLVSPGCRRRCGGRGHADGAPQDEPHLLRRTDLPERGPQHGRPRPGPDVQRRFDGVRPPAVLAWGVQQATLRLPARLEPAVPGVRSAREPCSCLERVRDDVAGVGGLSDRAGRLARRAGRGVRRRHDRGAAAATAVEPVLPRPSPRRRCSPRRRSSVGWRSRACGRRPHCCSRRR